MARGSQSATVYAGPTSWVQGSVLALGRVKIDFSPMLKYSPLANRTSTAAARSVGWCRRTQPASDGQSC